jgi:hypothetical protein
MMVTIVVTGGYASFGTVTNSQVYSNLLSKRGVQEQTAKLTGT